MKSLVLERNRDLFQTQLMKQFGKTENDLFDYMRVLKDWAETQVHFPEQPADNILKFFMVFNKFSIERVKQKLDMYYTIRSLMPDVFSEHPLSREMVEYSKICYCIPLPKHTDDYKRIIYCQFNPNYGPESFGHMKTLIRFIHIVELLIETDDCLGCYIIINFDHVKAGHIAKISPIILKQFSIITEKVYSNASVYITNLSSYGELAWNTMIKPILKQKILDRLRVFPTANLLINEFGKERLPHDLGGDLPSLAELNEMLLKQFEHYKARFDKLQVMKIDESRRPQKLENDEVLGYYGNFKKINLD